jgi:hypothetical protein
MSYLFMDGLYKAPIPTEVTIELDGKVQKIKLKGEIKERVEMQVRDQLDALAEPIRKDAITAFSVCVEGANQAGWFNEWSQLCEEYLNKMDPSAYPLSAEWKTEPFHEQLIYVPGQVIKVLK